MKVHQRVTEPHVKPRETGIHHSSVHRIVRQNLKLKCLKKGRVQELTDANCALRRTRARKLLRRSQHPLWTSYCSLMSLCES